MNDENNNTTNEGIKNSYYGTKLSFVGIKLFLAITTWIAGYAAGQAVIYSMTGYHSFWGAILFASLVAVFIDGSLDNDMNYALEKDNVSNFKWAKIALLCLATGGSTWFSASIIADMGTDYIDNDEREYLVAKAQQDQDNDLSRLTTDIANKKAEIEKLQTQYAKDTSAVLSAMNRHHAKYWRNGRWKAYYGNLPKYKSLTASIDKILAIDTVYQSLLSSLNGDLQTLNDAYTQTSSKDIAVIVAQSVEMENRREELRNNNTSIFIKSLDGVGIIILGLLFFDIRQMRKNDNLDLKMTSINVSRWLIDRLDDMKQRALNTPTKLDDALVDFLTSGVKIISSVLNLFNSITTVVLKAVNSIVGLLAQNNEEKTGEQVKSTTDKTGEVIASTTSVQTSDWIPISTNQRRTVIQPFRQQEKPGENSSTTDPVQPVQPQLATMVEQLNPVEQRRANTTVEKRAKVVEFSPKVKASTPVKSTPTSTVREVVEIIRDKTGEVLADINRGDKVEQVNILTVQKRKGSWKSKRDSAKTERGKSNAKRWYKFYSDLEGKMIAIRDKTT